MNNLLKFLKNVVKSLKLTFLSFTIKVDSIFIRPIVICHNSIHKTLIRKSLTAKFTYLLTCNKNQKLFYRTDDVAKNVSASNVVGRCVVLPASKLPHSEPVVWAQKGTYRFYYEKEYDVRSLEFVELREEASNYQPPSESLKSSKHPKIEAPLRTLDVFAGCGGLSAGLESSGVAKVGLSRNILFYTLFV
jgi:hypothetical protein